MKRILFSIQSFLTLLICVAAVCVPATRAQTRDKYLISAKAGGINFVSGNVTVLRKGMKSQEAVTDQDNLESGDVVTTGMGGRVEVLLNPGSYMRVAENSEFEMTNTALDNLRVRILKGSVIIEVVGTDDTKVSLDILTPQTSAKIIKRGLYRFNVLQSGATEVLVRKGRALVGPSALVVKSGNMISISRNGMSEVAKIDKRAQDSLELWSRERAEYLASINRRMPPASTIIDYSTDVWANNTYDRYNGRWVYDPRRNCYVFLPGRGGASSPYGYGYPNRGNCCNQQPTTPPQQAPAEPPVAGRPTADTPPDRTPGEDAPREPGEPGRGRNNRPREPLGGSRDGDIPNRPEPAEPVGNQQPSAPVNTPEPANRPEPSSSEPVSRPEPAPAPAPAPEPAPSYSPPPQPSSPPPSEPAPSQAPTRIEAPVTRPN
jgi:hypothetical protein